MSKKLTLNIEDHLILFAHDYSKHTGVSISKIFENYLAGLKIGTTKKKLNPMVKKLYGSFQNNPISDKKALRKIFHEKNSH